MTPNEFVQNWKFRNLSERESAQTHFSQLCRLLGVPAPYDNPGDDENYRFDAITSAAGSRVYSASKRTRTKRGTKTDGHTTRLFGDAPAPPKSEKTDGDSLTAPDAPATRIVSAKTKGHGFADVWKRGCFCWEYKRQGQSDLSAALVQLKQYRDSLDNPPLLIVCDVDAFEIHTNFTGYPTESYRFTLEDLANPSEEWLTKRGISPLILLKKVFDPVEASEWFRPKRKLSDITEAFAARVGELAESLKGSKTDDGKPVSDHEIAHFLMQMVFALFAQDIGLLPRKRVLNLIQKGNENPKDFTRKIRALFKAMEKGGDFGEDTIDWFNGGLFKDVDSQNIPKLMGGHLGIFVTGKDTDWSAIEPSILGTLFERALVPAKRSQIGAHYTSRDDIMLIIEPVVLAPLRKEFDAAKRETARLIDQRDSARSSAAKETSRQQIESTLRAFHDRLASVTILDPACGSGNFLYVAIQCLLELEKQLLAFAILDECGKIALKPRVSPLQLRGIEINDYAAELARISIWIGFLKWKKENAAYDADRPILKSLDTIENRDAILDRTTPKLPVAAKWPTADFIIGNPPFLGSKLFRKWGLSDDYLTDLFKTYDLPKTSDLCCYWFEVGRKAIESHAGTRVGLLATQGIRGGDNRTVLERIKKTGDIFLAWADRDWVLDGAAVQVSMVGFDDGAQSERLLGEVHNGASTLIAVPNINADLSSGADTGSARRLPENANLAYMGDTKGGSFDITHTRAAEMLGGSNPHGKSNAQVVLPWLNGLDVTRRERGMFVIDFGCDAERAVAALFEAPFRHVETYVRPERKDNRRDFYAENWWIHVEPRPSLRAGIGGRVRYLSTPTLTKHRLFKWLTAPTLPDHQLILFCREDDYFFGVLHSSIHELWALQQGTQLEDRPRYTPTSTFETFPLPWPPGQEPTKPADKHHALWKAIGSAAKELNDLREAWLNPPEWIAAVEKQVDIRYRADLASVPADARPLVRRSAVMAEAAKDKRLKTRTLTNLYNERPAWLRLAHEKLDRAAIAAYRALDPKGNWDPDWAAAYEPFGAGEITIKEKGKAADREPTIAAKHAAIAARAAIDPKVLGALLRLNLARAKTVSAKPAGSSVGTNRL